MRKRCLTIVGLLLLFVQFACLHDDDSPVGNTQETPTNTTTDSLPKDSSITPTPRSAFIAFPIKNAAAFSRLADSLGPERMELVLKINRRDTKHIHKNDTLILPPVYDDEALSPFPMVIDSIKDVPKMILISRRVQALAAYEYGRLVHWTGVSTGKRSTQTPAGFYHVNWKKELKISSVDSTWIMPWCVNIHSKWGVNIHAYGLPGYPASHACVRLPEEDAQWVFYWVDTWENFHGKTISGTPVIVFGDYAFGRRAPWKQLRNDDKAQTINAAELDEAISPRRPDILAIVKDREDMQKTDLSDASGK